MDSNDLSRMKIQRVPRSLLTLLALLLGLTMAVSLVNAGKSGQWGATELQLQNVDFLPRPVTTTFYSSFGAPTLVVTGSLIGGNSGFFFPQLPPQFTGTVSIDSPGQVLGVVTHLGDNPPGAAQWSLIDDTVLSNTAYVPHFSAPQTSGPASRLTIHNLEPLASTAWITFYDSSGIVMLTRTAQIPKSGALFLDRAGLNLPGPIQASAIIRADRRIYASIDRIYNQAFSSAHAPAQGGFEIAAPMFFAQYNGLDSVLSVQNVSPVTATGVLSYYEGISGALLVTQPFTLASCAALLWTPVPTISNSYGHVVATADKPIAGLVLGETLPSPGSPGLWDYTAVVVDPEKPDTLDRRTAYGPAIFSRYIGWNSQVFAANLSEKAVSLTIDYSSAPADLMTTTNMIVPPHGLAVFFDTPNLPREFEHASLRVSSDQLIAATIWSSNISAPDGYMAYEAQYASPVSENRAYLPLIMKPNGSPEKSLRSPPRR